MLTTCVPRASKRLCWLHSRRDTRRPRRQHLITLQACGSKFSIVPSYTDTLSPRCRGAFSCLSRPNLRSNLFITSLSHTHTHTHTHTSIHAQAGGAEVEGRRRQGRKEKASTHASCRRSQAASPWRSLAQNSSGSTKPRLRCTSCATSSTCTPGHAFKTGSTRGVDWGSAAQARGSKRGGGQKAPGACSQSTSTPPGALSLEHLPPDESWPLLLLATPCTSSCTEHAIRVFNVCVLAHARCERARERCDGHSSACLHTSFMSMRHQHSAHGSGTSGPTSGGRRVVGKRHK